MKRILIFSMMIFALSLSSGCGNDYGNLLESDELNVYFSDINDEDKAREVAVFYKENGFLGSNKQYIQLVRTESVVVLNLIASTDFNAKTISFDERKQLIELQKKIKESIFKEEIFEIHICNSQFKPLWNINS